MPDDASSRPKGTSLRPLRQLYPFILPHWRMLLLALFALLVGAGALLGLPVAIRYVIDFGIAGKDPDGWAGDFVVKFWAPEWKAILTAYLDRILADGYDGIYMDWLEAFEFGAVAKAAEALIGAHLA